MVERYISPPLHESPLSCMVMFQLVYLCQGYFPSKERQIKLLSDKFFFIIPNQTLQIQTCVKCLSLYFYSKISYPVTRILLAAISVMWPQVSDTSDQVQVWLMSSHSISPITGLYNRLGYRLIMLFFSISLIKSQPL